MFAHRKKLYLAAFSLTVASILCFYFYEPEPCYRGYTLSQWIIFSESSNDREAANDAVRKIGKKAVPCLIEWVGHEPHTSLGFKLKTTRLYRQFPVRLPDWLDYDIDAQERSARAVRGFAILGTNAVVAIPELTRLMYNTNKPFASACSAQALISLGKDAFPAIMAALGSSDSKVRINVIDALAGNAMGCGHFGAEAEASPAVPILISYTEGADPNLAGHAAFALGALKLDAPTVIPKLTNCLALTKPKGLRHAALQGLMLFGSKAEPAIPALRQVLTDSDPDLRTCAENALRQIVQEPQLTLFR